MANGACEKDRGGDWNGLLEQTREALATLRAEDLEELAARADCMLSATVGNDWIRQRIPSPQAQELADLTRQQRLLGKLLLATDRNLAVLRRMRGEAGERTGAGRARSPWER
jgi:hypothetical protein